MKIFLCAVLLWCSASNLFAAEITAKYKEGSYYLNATFEVEASADKIIGVLTDYENITRLNPSIVESEILESPSQERTRIRTVVKDCAIFFCKEIIRVENVTQHGLTSLEAEVLPFLSDLRSGHTQWKFLERGGVTEVTYQSSMQPKFWIPPIIRSHTVTRKIKKRIMETVQRLQSLAPEYE